MTLFYIAGALLLAGVIITLIVEGSMNAVAYEARKLHARKESNIFKVLEETHPATDEEILKASPIVAEASKELIKNHIKSIEK